MTTETRSAAKAPEPAIPRLMHAPANQSEALRVLNEDGELPLRTNEDNAYYQGRTIGFLNLASLALQSARSALPGNGMTFKQGERALVIQTHIGQLALEVMRGRPA